MSEPNLSICPNCHNVMSRCTCNTKKIKIEVSRDSEVDSLHEDLYDVKGELEQKTAEIANAALQMFENDKIAYSKGFPAWKSKIEACTNAQELSDLTDKISNSRPTVSGKAQIDSPQGNQEFASHKEMLDSIYTVLGHKSRFTKEQIEDAEKMRRQLLKSMMDGQSLKTMKRDGKSVYAHTNLLMCPTCERESHITTTIDLEKESECPKCGYKVKQDEIDR